MEIKAVIIMICFKEIYSIGVSIVGEFLNSILNVMTVGETNLAVALSNNIQRRNFYSNCLLSFTHLLVIINMSVHNERHRTISNEDSNSICNNRIVK